MDHVPVPNNINATDEARTKTFLSTFPSEAVINILKHLPSKELVNNVRLVCKEWESAVQQSGCLDQRQMWGTFKNQDSVESFKRLSPTFPVRKFHFEGLDLEVNFLGDPLVFRRFAMGHCLQMTALSISKCGLPASRFIELLAFCRNLKHLEIKDSPTLLRTDFSMFHWAFFVKDAMENLARLQKLTFRGRIEEQDLMGLTRDMKALINFHICTEVLPIRAIREIFKSNADTLKQVTIRGSIDFWTNFDTGFLPDETTQMSKLMRLVMVKSQLHDGNIVMLEKFVARCPNLTDLKMVMCRVTKPMLSSIENKIKKLELCGCSFGIDVFKESKFSTLKILKLQMGRNEEPQAASVIYNLTLSSFSQLTSLEFQQIPSSQVVFLRNLSRTKMPQLTSLALIEFVALGGPVLRQIFKEFPQLSALSIKDTPNVVDDTLCPCENSSEGCLANLKNMKELDLSGTSVGNKTVRECILEMNKMKRLVLKKTKVDLEGYEMIMASLAQSLKYVNF